MSNVINFFHYKAPRLQLENGMNLYQYNEFLKDVFSDEVSEAWSNLKYAFGFTNGHPVLFSSFPSKDF